MSRPLMNSLIGQFNHRRNIKYTRGLPREKKPHELDDRSYQLSDINFDVKTFKETNMNKNIKGHLLEEDKMIELGFIERHTYWELRKKISHIEGMEEYMVVTIGKVSESIRIVVYDAYMKRNYDYQMHLKNEPLNRYANTISIRMQKEMKWLMSEGIISGYKEGDYI